MISLAKVFSFSGLVMDCIGAIFLGIAFFRMQYEEMKRQSIPIAGIHPLIFKSLADQKAKGITGTIFLLIGFLLQFVGNIPINVKIHFSFLLIIVLTEFILGYSVYKYGKSVYRKLISKVKNDEDALTDEELKRVGMTYD